MKEIVKKPWEYSFYENENSYIISVVCGSVAIFEITILLNQDEKQEYVLKGLSYLDELAKKIQFSPKLYSDRNIENFTMS